MVDDDKNVFITTFASVKVKKIDRDKFKWLGGNDVSQWCFGLPTWFLLFNTDTFAKNVILYFSLHILPVETVPYQRCCPVYALMAQFIMEFPQDSTFVFFR